MRLIFEFCHVYGCCDKFLFMHDGISVSLGFLKINGRFTRTAKAVRSAYFL